MLYVCVYADGARAVLLYDEISFVARCLAPREFHSQGGRHAHTHNKHTTSESTHTATTIARILRDLARFMNVSQSSVRAVLCRSLFELSGRGPSSSSQQRRAMVCTIRTHARKSAIRARTLEMLTHLGRSPRVRRARTAQKTRPHICFYCVCTRG